MVRIRLRRVGARHQPSYRIVAAEKESPRDGKFLEVLGHYNPRTEPSTIDVDEARLFHWLRNGAQPSDAVVSALRSLGTWERWERFKSGEDLEKLVTEAEAAIQEVDPRTRRDDLIEKRAKAKPKKKKKKAEAAPVETPEVEAEEETTEAVEAEPEAEEPKATDEIQESEGESEEEAEASDEDKEE